MSGSRGEDPRICKSTNLWTRWWTTNFPQCISMRLCVWCVKTVWWVGECGWVLTKSKKARTLEVPELKRSEHKLTTQQKTNKQVNLYIIVSLICRSWPETQFLKPSAELLMIYELSALPTGYWGHPNNNLRFLHSNRKRLGFLHYGFQLLK